MQNAFSEMGEENSSELACVREFLNINHTKKQDLQLDLKL